MTGMHRTFAAVAALIAGAMAAGRGAQAQTTASVWDGIYTSAQAARGSGEFSAHCAGCHGAALDGTGEAPALAGAQFLSDFDGLSVGELYDRIRTSMPQFSPSSSSPTPFRTAPRNSIAAANISRRSVSRPPIRIQARVKRSSR